MIATLHRIILALVILVLWLSPCYKTEAQTTQWSLAIIDGILASTNPVETLVRVGDMDIQVSLLKHWRDQLAGQVEPRVAFDGTAPLWTSGNVYYSFDPSVSSSKQRAFVDACGEWATFANLHFTPRSAQPNYITVIEDPTLVGGGLSAIGMVGGQQFLRISPTAWNRPTLCHELGHALGLVHEQQRSDRDLYITVLTNNIVPGQEGNFVKLGNSQNISGYDFLSIMHYSRYAFSTDPSTLDTMEPLPAYSQYLNLMGQKFEPVLSLSDRAGMIAKYGAGPALTSVVTNTLDSGPGSLRAALYFAIDHPATTVTFNIPTSDPGFSNNVFNILPSDQLPGLVNATIIDGGTEPTNSNSSGPEILLNGAFAVTPGTFANGLKLIGTNCAVRFLVVNGFSQSGILIDGTTALSNAITGCYLGVNGSGSAAVPNSFASVTISGGATGNTVGGTSASLRNIISGSGSQGVILKDSGTRNNLIQGNYIGLNAAGTSALANSHSGVAIYNGAQSNTIGGLTPSARNIISGNGNQGIAISDSGTRGNSIIGNYIGLNSDGTAALPNNNSGVAIYNEAQSNVVGGIVVSARNIISGNANQGVIIENTNTIGNTISGNFIGLSPDGASAIGNVFAGVSIFNGATFNSIGGNISGAGNVISGNGKQGVTISTPGTMNNLVAANVIGLNGTGTAALPNSWSGMAIFGGAQSNVIGGTSGFGRNIISGNANEGIVLANAPTIGNAVIGNYIGLNPAGTSAASNAWSGIHIVDGANGNSIGGTLPGAGNVVSGNGNQGIILEDAITVNNLIQGNLIGLNAAGTAAISNAWSGIEIYNGPSGNLIGGGPGARNFISGNGNYGISINTDSAGNQVLGNTVGLNTINSAAIPNQYSGIVLFDGAQSNVIGGTAFGNANLIAGNLSDAVSIFDATSAGNSVVGNSMFGNSGIGIGLYSGANNSAVSPSLTSAIVTTVTSVSGSLNSAANSVYELDFYSSPAPASSAQGRIWLGSRQATTGAGGTISFSFTFGALVPAGRVITATATDSAGNTSQMSFGAPVSMISTVNDGIPDAWRALYFGGAGTTTNSASCAACDADGDGMSNFQEFLANTNPTNKTSSLKLVALPVNGSNDRASFNSSTGAVYRIEARDDLGTGAWSIIADQILGTGGTILIIDPAAALLPRRFYRAEVLW